MFVDPNDFTAEALDKLRPTCGECGSAAATLFAGGKLYRDTMALLVRPNARGVTETDGKGIGFQRAQLRAWIEEHCR